MIPKSEREKMRQDAEVVLRRRYNGLPDRLAKDTLRLLKSYERLLKKHKEETDESTPEAGDSSPLRES